MVQEWRDYLNDLVSESCSLDNLVFSSDKGGNLVPPIIKATVAMLSQMISENYKHNIIVLPESSYSTFLFAISNLIYSVEKGHIEKIYNPKNFKKGDKITYNGCVVEYLGYGTTKGKACLYLKTSDLDKITAPIEILPIFSSSKYKKVSNTAKYDKVTTDARNSISSQNQSNQFLNQLKKYRGHMSESIYCVAPITKIKNKFLSTNINDTNINDILCIALANYDGDIRNIRLQSIGGTPSIVLSSDLYAVREALENEYPLQSIIIEVTKPADINNQLDALDELIKTDIPITIFSDVVNSFHLQNLSNRGFKTWRWDKNSITHHLHETSFNAINSKLLNCQKMEVQYQSFEGSILTDILHLLNKHQESIKSHPKSISDIFHKLFKLFFIASWNIIQIENEKIAHIMDILETCRHSLLNEREFISKQEFLDYSEAIESLIIFYTTKSNIKSDAILKLITELTITPVCIVISERSERGPIKEYWNKVSKNHFIPEIDFLFPQEFYHSENSNYALTIIVGWFNENLMKKILYSYNSRKYLVLLYDHELRWKEGRVYSWTKTLNTSDNKEIVEHIFNKGRQRPISTSNFEPATIEKEPNEQNELENIELVLNFNKYQQYIASDDGTSSSDEIVDTIPINFLGDFIAFYKETHQIICVTSIMIDESDEIEIKLPDKLETGDFIVVRETNSDIIREMADIILEKNGMSDLRTISEQWSDSIYRMYQSNGFDNLYTKLTEAGSHVIKQTVWGWINGLTILPRNKQTIEQIAKATGDAALLINKNEVYNAGKKIRSVHRKAGTHLSKSLKKELPRKLLAMENVNIDDIYKPITLDLEDIGTITILKIIEIGDSIKVNSANTNRLFKEV